LKFVISLYDKKIENKDKDWKITIALYFSMW